VLRELHFLVFAILMQLKAIPLLRARGNPQQARETKCKELAGLILMPF
jgi:hypothetical protein